MKAADNQREGIPISRMAHANASATSDASAKPRKRARMKRCIPLTCGPPVVHTKNNRKERTIDGAKNRPKIDRIQTVAGRCPTQRLAN